MGDVLVAEGTRSRVAELDLARHLAICRLFEGSHTSRRFRAQSIIKGEGGAGP